MVNEDNNKVGKDQIEKSEAKPFILTKKEIIGDFLDINRDYIESLDHQILVENKPFPYICIKLKDIMIFDENLYRYVKGDPENAIKDICKVLNDKVKLNQDVDSFLQKKEKCRFEEIHLCFNLETIKEDIPLYQNLSLGTKPYVNKLTRIIARFNDLELYREDVAIIITYTCFLCGANIEIRQFKVRRGKYKKPTFCIKSNCRAKGSGDFFVKKIEKYHEMGGFKISDIDFSKRKEMECYTFLNFDYFSKKMQEINLNDVIDIIGIIKLDASDVGTRKEDQKIQEYVKIIDFNPTELKTTDPNIIKGLYENFRSDKDYHHRILNSIHPLTKGIYTFLIFKIVILLGLISADSWDSVVKNRCSINYIVGSIPSLFKGSISAAFRRIVGINNMGNISGLNSTPKAFLPTSQRGKDKDFQIRFGAFAYNNKRLLIVDEAKNMLGNKDLSEPIKDLEDGVINRGSDGTILHAECKLCVGFLMNYTSEEQFEGYDYSKTLRENLCNIAESTLQRIDLHYTMLNLPIQIEEVLERRIFRNDETILEDERSYNYINEVKRIYPLQKISKSMENKIIAYMKLLRIERGINRQNIRELRTLIKLLCGISAIRLKTEVDESDLEYLQKHLVNLMIPFFEYDKVRELKSKLIDMNEIYLNTFKLLTEIKDEIPIFEHISLIRQFLEAHYFPYPDSVIKDPAITNKIDKYMKSETGLTDNQKYKTLLENKENVKYIENIGYVRANKGNKTHFIKQNYLNEVIINRIREIFKDNKNKPIEYNGTIQILEFDMPYERDLMVKSIKYHIKNKNLIKTKENYLKLDGDGGDNERGDH